MEVKSEKGYTGIDIAISVIVLFIFISLIAILSYNFNSSSQEIKLKAEATQIAVEEMEQLKNELSFEEIKDIRNSEYKKEEIKTGFFETILIQDYADRNPDKVFGLVKKVTVKIQYIWKGKEQAIELSTILSKES